MKGFDGDYALELGEIYGLRQWKLDLRGVLLPRNLSKPPWTPGENVATCQIRQFSLSAKHIVDPEGRGRTAIRFEMGYYARRQAPSKPLSYRSSDSLADKLGMTFEVEHVLMYGITWNDGTSGVYDNIDVAWPGNHPAPDDTCTCGFYAYYSAENQDQDPYRATAIVTGLIRGYGRTIIGEKGFRCEKAEIIAFQAPVVLSEDSMAFMELYECLTARKSAPTAKNRREWLENNFPDVPVLETRKELLEFAPLGDPSEK